MLSDKVKIKLWLESLAEKFKVDIYDEIKLCEPESDYAMCFAISDVTPNTKILLCFTDANVYTDYSFYVLLLQLQQKAMREHYTGFATVLATVRYLDQRFEYALENNRRMLTISKRFSFAYGHHLHSAILTEQQNRDIFGKCYNMHGHNANLEVILKGWADNVTGMHVNFVDLKRIVNRIIDEHFDHTSLNDSTLYDSVTPRTVENTLPVLFGLIKKEIPTLSEIRLSETDTSWASYKEEM